MLSTPNALAVTFRDVLHGDPLHYELLGILGKKYAPAPSQCAPAVPAPAPPSGVTLPGVTLTDEGAFDELHAEIEQRITALREAGSSLTRHEMMAIKAHLLKRLAAPAPAPPSGVTLPGVTLTDEGAFDELHAEEMHPRQGWVASPIVGVLGSPAAKMV